MNRTVSKNGKTVSLCNYRFVLPDGKIELCNAPKACPVCGQCSRLDGEHERGHCTGHFGLHYSIPVPGNEAFRKYEKARLEEK